MLCNNNAETFSQELTVFSPICFNGDNFPNLKVRFDGSKKLGRSNRNTLEILQPRKDWKITLIESGFWFFKVTNDTLVNDYEPNSELCKTIHPELSNTKLELSFDKNVKFHHKSGRHIVLRFELSENSSSSSLFSLVFEVGKNIISRGFEIVENSIAFVRSYSNNVEDMKKDFISQKQNRSIMADMNFTRLLKTYGPMISPSIEDSENHLKFTFNLIYPNNSLSIYFVLQTIEQECLRVEITNFGKMDDGAYCMDFLTPLLPFNVIDSCKTKYIPAIVHLVLELEAGPRYFFNGSKNYVYLAESSTMSQNRGTIYLGNFDGNFNNYSTANFGNNAANASSSNPEAIYHTFNGNHFYNATQYYSVEEIISNRDIMINIAQKYQSRRDLFGYRLLDHVLIRGYIEWARILLDLTKDTVMNYDSMGTSTLEWCVYYNSLEVISEFFLEENLDLTGEQVSHPKILTESLKREYGKKILIETSLQSTSLNQVEFKLEKNSSTLIRMWFDSLENLCNYLSFRFTQLALKGNFTSVAILHMSKPNIFVLEYVKKVIEPVVTRESQKVQKDNTNHSHTKKSNNRTSNPKDEYVTSKQLNFASLYENGDYEQVFELLKNNTKLKLDRNDSNCPEYLALLTVCKLTNVNLEKGSHKNISNSFKHYVNRFGGFYNSLNLKDQETIENCYKCFELCRNTRISNTLNCLKDRKIYLSASRDIEAASLETFKRLADHNGPFFYVTKKDEEEKRNYLSIAIIFGRLDIVKYLMENFNVSIYETATHNEYSLLHYSNYYGNYPIAHYLKAEKQIISLNKNKKEENEFQSFIQGVIDRRRRWGNLMDNSNFEMELKGFYTLYAGYYSLFDKYCPPVSKTNTMRRFSPLSDVIIKSQH